MQYFASEQEAQEWEDYFSSNYEAPLPTQYIQHMEKKSSSKVNAKGASSKQASLQQAQNSVKQQHGEKAQMRDPQMIA